VPLGLRATAYLSCAYRGNSRRTVRFDNAVGHRCCNRIIVGLARCWRTDKGEAPMGSGVVGMADQAILRGVNTLDVQFCLTNGFTVHWNYGLRRIPLRNTELHPVANGYVLCNTARQLGQ